MTGIKLHISFLLFAAVFCMPAWGQVISAKNKPSGIEKEKTPAIPSDTLKKVLGMSPEEAIAILNHQGGDTLKAHEVKKLEKQRKKEAKKRAKEHKKQERLRREVDEYFTRVVIDSSRKAVVDTVEHDPLLDSLTIPGTDYYKKDDSTMVAEALMLKKPPAPKVKSASHAAFLSALVPGLGQIYGGSQWWMAPIFWGGMTGTIMAVSYYNGYYNDFRKEYKNRMLTGEVHDYDYFDNQTLVDRMQMAEQQRDLWIIGTVGVYLLNVLHANVSVQLSEFRIQKKHRKMLELQNMFEQQQSTPSSVSFSPSMITPNMGVNHLPVPGLRLAFDF